MVVQIKEIRKNLFRVSNRLTKDELIGVIALTVAVVGLGTQIVRFFLG